MAFESKGSNYSYKPSYATYGTLNNDAISVFSNKKVNEYNIDYIEPDYGNVDPNNAVIKNNSNITTDFTFDEIEKDIFGREIFVDKLYDENGNYIGETKYLKNGYVISDSTKNWFSFKNPSNHSDKKIWSNWYGNSSKHTSSRLSYWINSGKVKLSKKTGIGRAFKYDKYDRKIGVDKYGFVYEKGTVVEDRDGNKYLGNGFWEDKNKKIFKGKTPPSDVFARRFTQNIEGRLNAMTAYDVDIDGSSKSLYSDLQGKVSSFGAELDKKAANSKFGKYITEKNAKYGQDSVIGSKNNYRVGQNLSYGNVKVAGGSADWEGSVIGASGSIGNENLGLGGSVDVLHAEAHAGWEASPDHIEASVSAQASLLHLEGNAQAIHEFKNPNYKIGVSGNAEADLAKVYAGAKVSAGLYKDEMGNVHLDAGVKGEIGADLCSATASGKVSLGAVDVGVTGTVKVGIGAQANIGFEDGKLNFHIGAALGVGFEVGFSIDVSRGINVISDWITSW